MRDPKIFTISPCLPFAGTLAEGILHRYGDDPINLSSLQVLLPTRRACRSLREAFLRLRNGQPLLLPKMAPLGDVDEEELILSGTAAAKGVAEIPPAIPPLRRQLLLADLITSRDREIPLDQALKLAIDLGKLLDQVEVEGLTFDNLGSLVPDAYASHWQKTLAFLEVLTAGWPALLANYGCINGADRRNRLLHAQATLWSAAPPRSPVIAAGSTGSIPATAALLDVVSRLPQGMVVLPGFDLAMSEPVRASLPTTHPQYGMAQLLHRLDISANTVTDWSTIHCSQILGAPPSRARLLADVLRPDATTDGWQDVALHGPESIAGVSLLECSSPQEEGSAIATIMREALETPHRTAALITPDRTLGRRVATELKRWDIAVDDSAGIPLADTPIGVFLRLTARMIVGNFAPIPLLLALKHPFAAGGLSLGAFKTLARKLERRVLRGPRPAAGIEGLRRHLANLTAKHSSPGDGDVANFIGLLDGLSQQFVAISGRGHVSLAQVLQAHIQFAEMLAATDIQPGAERLWAGDDGEVAARFIADVAENAQLDDSTVDGSQYPAVLEALMAGSVVRPSHSLHPRLSIWGPLEARLQQADVVIMGGLNEGTWPNATDIGPWMSRPMAAQFGLPERERQVGQSAHDFVQLFCAREVVLTRATRVDGTPTVRNRWLERLVTFLGKDIQLHRRQDVLTWVHRLDAIDGASRPIEPPAPCPPLSARPRELSVTQIELWMRDPYALYAKHILGLKALDLIDTDPGVADYGTFIHQALEIFSKRHASGLPADALQELLGIGREAFGDALAHPGIWGFWWPRFERIAAWFIKLDDVRRQNLAMLHAETRGALIIDAPHGAFTLSAKADRIEARQDGSLALIDYKTGTVPSWSVVQSGFSPQLPLEAAIAAAGGFAAVRSGEISDLEYWRVSGGDPTGEVVKFRHNASEAAAKALAGLKDLVARFDDPTTPYPAQPRPEWAPRYSDYEHLARLQEWEAGIGGGNCR
ncbi:MAG: double-strand break repair protein AddB [Desulfovibrio sp.]|uniref:double-strand break repair protein AddB n=1 Tax=Desulfovibrio sp. TaxID=885 RepID=UPI00135D9A77|nr:double-strand break repair protein AddB [Desulfovibrio sp.]MTJ93878.1 double-strand break repair protein AddB [Desulfovibrio sp.]